MGEMLRDTDLSKGGRPSETSDHQSGVSLSEIGVSYKDSSQWQAIASLPYETFVEQISIGRTERKPPLRVDPRDVQRALAKVRADPSLSELARPLELLDEVLWNASNRAPGA